MTTISSTKTIATERTLKYLFTVLYSDGSVFQQPTDDISVVDAKRSAFTDAAHRIENGRFILDERGQLVSRIQDIHRFLLEDGATSYMVDLITGHFEVNCVPFRIHEIEIEYSNRRLIFVRRHYQKVTLTGAETAMGASRIVYRLGWQGNTPDGKNAQFVMEID